MLRLFSRASRALPAATRISIPAIALILTMANGVSAQVNQPAVTVAAVDQALDKAKKFLLAHEKQGNWEVSQAPNPKGLPWDLNGGQWGGLTSMATYALLASGESVNNPKLKPAIDFIEHADMRGIYALSMRDMAMLYVPSAPIKRLIALHDGESLFQAIAKEGPTQALYEYYVGDPSREIDHSSSQYGVLGIWACSQNGYEVPDVYWRAVQSVWSQQQMPDGGWCYNPADTAMGHNQSSPTMTAAGIATLFIADDNADPTAGLNCEPIPANQSIGKGFEWIQSHSNDIFAGTFAHHYYGFYGLERIGVASGRKYFGTHDWFREITSVLLREQQPDGSWFEGTWGAAYGGSIADTAFGILFLARGRAALMMNKLDFSADEPEKQHDDDDWNIRPRDLANLSAWAGQQTEHELNWQVVNLIEPSTDYQDAPILYIAAKNLPQLSPEHIKRLSDFVARGGLILGNADCGSRTFAAQFRKLGETIFPNYEFRSLPTTHPIFTNEQFSANRWLRKPTLLGLSNGVREVMLLVPDADLSRAWQSRSINAHRELFQLGANIYQYATDKRADLIKGSSYIVESDPRIVATKKIKVARISYDANWDPEPRAWLQLGNLMHNQNRIDLQVVTIPLGKGQLAASGAVLASITGTDPFTFSAEQQQELKNFVARGGTLLIDAAGGSSTFADDMESLLRQDFPSEATAGMASPLPANAPVYTINGAAPLSVQYRMFAKSRLTGNSDAPRVIGLNVAGKRVGIFFSREDLTAGLVGEPIDGIVGYAPASATAIVRDILQYAAAR